MVSYTEKALESKKAKEALGEGVLKLVKTGELQKAIDAALSSGEKSGALTEVKVGVLLDLLNEISREWKATGYRSKSTRETIQV